MTKVLTGLNNGDASMELKLMVAYSAAEHSYGKSGELRRLYDYWILGKSATRREPRWSIVRDLLGWVD